jgi:hypothetical protein
VKPHPVFEARRLKSALGWYVRVSWAMAKLNTSAASHPRRTHRIEEK